MGMLVDGEWRFEEAVFKADAKGAFQRPQSAYRDWVTADGSSGFKAEAGRYHLYAAHLCPWAHRTLIFRALKKLEHAVEISLAQPVAYDQGWKFGPTAEAPEATVDKLTGFTWLHQIYSAADPHATGRATVPVLFDVKTKRVVNNESSEIIRMFNSAFAGIAGSDADYYPEALRPEIDALNARIYDAVNNGVYRCGFAQSQAAYDEAYDALFGMLDELEQRLSTQRYLVGARQTEADWRLFPTLVRFDVAYFSIFKCNRQRIADYPNLSNYMRDLYSTPGIADTVKPRHYVMSYFSLKQLNPSGIIPKGAPVDYTAPHDRARFG